jgi:hypothetical protein
MSAPLATRNGLSRYEKGLLALFLVSLPFVNPWVRGDGVGYYAWARAPLIEHSLNFRADWLRANESFRLSRLRGQGSSEQIAPGQYTVTGHLDNHFSVGPALLWAPFLIVAHLGVKIANAFGAHIAADGFSRPYLVAMALGTALYGFAAVWVAFGIARKFVPEGWAFLSALGVWFASSLPVYMYFNPSWSHAHSACAVALFIWYWLRTNDERKPLQWLALGAIGGFMMDVYYINAVLLFLPLADSVREFTRALRVGEKGRITRLFGGNLLFSVALIVAFLPTLVTKRIIYGGFFKFGYTEHWYWNSPAFFKVLFSSDHGFLLWTPVLILAVAGLAMFAAKEKYLGGLLLSVLILYVYTIGCYEDWDGISSYGNRFFVSLTLIFVIGLAALFDSLAKAIEARRAAWTASLATTALILINFGLIFQWGMHLIPPRGPVSWRVAAYNQVVVVPTMATGMVKSYLTGRSSLMNQIEQRDVQELQTGPGVSH